jgi:hypothetical protein
MCANPTDSANLGSEDSTRPGPIEQELPLKASQLGAYLDRHLATETEMYVKSRHIAEDIDLSAKEIGWYLRRLQESPTPLTVEQWAYTNGTTWRLTYE